MWLGLPALAGLTVAAAYIVLPVAIRDSWYELTAALLVFVFPLIWAYLLARRARIAYGREWQVLDRTRTTTLADRERLVAQASIAPGEQEQLLDPRRYFGRHAASGGQEERIAERMVQQAIHNAREMRRDSDVATQIYIRDLGPHRLALRVPQTVALRLGILFSFVGLLQGLQSLAGWEQGGTGILIPQVIAGLTGAFACSIAGIGAAILIQMLIVIVDRDYLIVARLLESTWMDLGHTLSQLRLKGDLPAMLDRVFGELETHRQEMRETSRDLREQTQLGLQAAADNEERLKQFVRSSLQTQGSLQELAEAQRARASDVSSALQQLEQYEARWAKLLAERVDQALTLQEQRYEAAKRELVETLTAQQRDLANDIKGAVRGDVDGLEQNIERLRQVMERHAQALQSATDSLASIAHRQERNESTLPQAAPRRSLVVPIGGAVLITLVLVYSMLAVLAR